MILISIALLIFQLEISGKLFNNKQPANIPDILIKLDVFHLDIPGGKKDNDEQ